jgi:hypothetical protein
MGLPINAEVKVSSGGKFNSEFTFRSENMTYDGPVTIDADGNIDDSMLVGRDSAGVEQRDDAMATATFLQVGAAMEDDLLVIQDSSSDGATDVQLVLGRG